MVNKVVRWFESQPGWAKVACYQVISGLLAAAAIKLTSAEPSTAEVAAIIAGFNMAVKTLRDALPAGE